MVLCWVDINLWPGQVQDFSDLGKKLTSRPNWYRWSKAELVSKDFRFIQASCLEHFLKAEKSWKKPGQRFNVDPTVFQAYHDISILCCIKLWSWQLLCMKVLIHGKDRFYFISRMPREKIRTGNPSRQERKCNGQPVKNIAPKGTKIESVPNETFKYSRISVGPL